MSAPADAAGAKARPILFSGPMVRALLEGRKTQTRRVVTPQPKHTNTWTTLRYFGDGLAIECGPDYPDGDDDERRCPHGVPGDLLWVRETCRAEELGDDWATYPQHIIDRYVDESNQAAGLDGVRYLADDAFIEIENSEAASNRWGELRAYRYPHGHGPEDPPHDVRSIHMPRWASRLTLRLTDVRVQRVQEIAGTQDVVAEGIRPELIAGHDIDIDGGIYPSGMRKFDAAFRELWNSLNEKRGYGWNANPWVWALSFTVEQRNVDDVLREAS